MDDLDDLIDCDKELKLNDPLLSFPLFDTPPSSSHSSSVPSSPSSMSSTTTTSSSPASKRSKRSCVKESMFELSFGSDDDFDSGNDESQRRRKKNKYHSSTSTSSSHSSSIECTNSNKNERTSEAALNLKDPMMSTSHSPSHFSNDLSYMDSMFFSSQYLSPSLSADDSIDLCAILKTEYDHDTEIMIG